MNVGRDGGDPVDGEFNGRRWWGWTDGLQTWKPFRIPWHANTEPEYTDRPMNFDLAAHAEGIGMTGWDWVNRLSRWAGFDFDAITGHADRHTSKLTEAQLREVQEAACAVDWVTARRSTSGNGLHLYVHLDPPVPTANHIEHAGLARAVLGRLAALTGFDFQARVDAAGGNMWAWHRKQRGTDGLTLLKRGVPLADVPPDWRGYVPDVAGTRRRTMPQVLAVEDKRSDRDRLFDELAGTGDVALDTEHHRLLDWLHEQGAPWTWNADHHMLVTHTYWLKEAHRALALTGPFETVSTGRNKTTDINCYAYPLKNGAWVVRRYTPGVAEAATWGKDKGGWTRCFLNRDPGLRAHGRAGFSLNIPLRTSTGQTGEI